MDLESFFHCPDSDKNLLVQPGVLELRRFGCGQPRLLLELPHGATTRREFDQLAARLEKGRFPENLIDFFFVNTDIGTPECAFEIARGFADRERCDDTSAIVLRSLIPRTFIDCNRVVQSADAKFLETGVTQAIPDYIRAPRDLELLLSMHRGYQQAADTAYREVCNDGGLAIALHSYAPRSVAIDRVDGDIVRALKEAYRPEKWARWPERPEVDVLDRDTDGQRLSPLSLVEDLVQRFAESGFEAQRNATYQLHPATSGHRHAKRYPERVLCLELRRDLLVDDFEPFEPMRISEPKVTKICRPVIEASRQFVGP